MKQIKVHFQGWNLSRIIRIALGTSLLIAYYYNRESFFLFVGLILSVQAIFNITCPDGSCSTGVDKDTKAIVKVKRYEPEK